VRCVCKGKVEVSDCCQIFMEGEWGLWLVLSIMRSG